MDFTEEREELASFMRRLYERRLTTSTGGNASLRLDGGRMLITQSGMDKGATRPGDLVVMRIGGGPPGGDSKPSMESGLHAAVYMKRPDVRSVMHAHPVFATAFCSTGGRIRFDLTAESRAVLGEPAFVPYAMMGSPALAEAVSDAMLGADTVLMGNHGVVAAGGSPAEAFNRIELVEDAAKITFMVGFSGGGRTLTGDELNLIDALFGKNRPAR
ncbi:MAG: class II aldolase/adducin family protein [Candidatus Krumholzibacteria bacterium]|jgi:L-fuculose-phosphate aldolase|nr:class II aldolase/adducin family protein [Candidatus Krumholzibacteria bacterium]